jgi:hypothetical protein
MIDLWLDTGTAGIVLIPFVLLYLISAALTWLTFASPARPFFASCIGVAGPFFVSVAVLFSLFAAFLANDVMRQNERAQAAVTREADGVRTILRLAESLGEAGNPVQSAALSYAASVLDEEWPQMRLGTMPAENLSALRQLILAVVAPKTAASAASTAHQAMVDALVEIRQARMERFALIAHESAPINWLGMIILGIITQVAVAAVHLERPQPQVLALLIFTAGFAATVALVGLNERPFANGAIDDAPLRAAIASARP